MGEDLSAPGRMAVRSPMQWTAGENGGFSNADAAALPSKLAEGDYGPENVNVADAKRDPESLPNFMIFLTRRYRECPELAWGEFSVLDQPFPQVIAHRCTWAESTIVALHNLGGGPVAVPLSPPANRKK
ncbi:hypothetical protein GCM10027052_23050 [Parafrigoribacterium mesophilum]|uniref:hypothetical protein n=1 Tax=Parafrigoribacterium mesophilum TaxID=433646 RepID=UPI0031FE3D2C